MREARFGSQENSRRNTRSLLSARLEGPHSKDMSYGSATGDPDARRRSDADAMLAYLKAQCGRCSFVRPRDVPTLGSCRRRRLYAAMDWYRLALGDVAGERARDGGRAATARSKGSDEDRCAERAERKRSSFTLLEGSALVPLDARLGAR